jgi:type II secretory pathway predicted ATPase ExeA
MTAFEKFNWDTNPFVLKIDPKLFTGYEGAVNTILDHIENRHKIALITGSTGSGKTTILRWLETQIQGVSTLYISKPPKDPQEFIRIFTDIYRPSLLEHFLNKSPTLYTLPKYVNEKLKGQHLLLLIDESHETNKDVMEWIRVLVDQIENVTLILAGLPVLESKIKENLQTLDQRITSRIRLTSLTEPETVDFIRKRILSVSGQGFKPFTEESIHKIYHRTGGFPREVLKMCDRLITKAFEDQLNEISPEDIEELRELPEKVRVNEETVKFSPRPPSSDQIQNLPFRQRQILEILSREDWQSPGTIVSGLDLEKYKSRAHAVRSVNNILHRLMLDGYVQRESRGKLYLYNLTPKLRTVFVSQ